MMDYTDTMEYGFEYTKKIIHNILIDIAVVFVVLFSLFIAILGFPFYVIGKLTKRDVKEVGVE